MLPTLRALRRKLAFWCSTRSDQCPGPVEFSWPVDEARTLKLAQQVKLLRRNLLEKNDWLSLRRPAVADASLEVVDSNWPTSGVRFPDAGAPRIIVTRALLDFVTAMNAVHVKGVESGRQQNSLTANVLYQYAVALGPRSSSNSGPWRSPEMPRLRDDRFKKALSAETTIHYTFLIAHEFAHIYLELQQRVDAEGETPFILQKVRTSSLLMSDPIPMGEHREAKADDLAIDLCAGVFGTSSEMLLSLYRLSRYFLWLDNVIQSFATVVRSTDMDTAGRSEAATTRGWYPRHSCLRHVTEARLGREAAATSQELEWLEWNMEMGAFDAAHAAAAGRSLEFSLHQAL